MTTHTTTHGSFVPRDNGAAEHFPVKPLKPQIALARALAVEDPAALFTPPIPLRAIQALSHNTRRAYRADWCTFVECCRRFGFLPLPASAEAVETFIEWRSPEQEKLVEAKAYRYVRAGEPRDPLSAAALTRALSAIGAVHRWLALPDPTQDEDVTATLKINIDGRRVQKQKDPLRWAQIEVALTTLGDDLRSLRNKAMVALAHSTLLRRAELVASQHEDYRRTPGEEHARLVVTRTKTKDADEEIFRHVTREAVEHLERWLKAAEIKSGPMFRGVTPNNRVKNEALNAAQVSRIFKEIARVAGVHDIERIGGHSTRIGATHDLKVFGADTLDIMHEGRWASHKMPKRYLDGLESERGAMAQMARARMVQSRSEENTSESDS